MSIQLSRDEIRQKARLAIEEADGGTNNIMQYGLSGPINDVLKAKISIHRSDDSGYFKIHMMILTMVNSNEYN